MTIRKANDEFISQLEKINNDVIVLGEYQNAKTPVVCKCRICDYNWNGIPNNLLRGEGCINCSGKKKKTQSEFEDEIKRIHPFINIVGCYKNNKTPIVCECNNCGYVWETIPSSLLKGHGCKKCSHKKAIAKRLRKS